MENNRSSNSHHPTRRQTNRQPTGARQMPSPQNQQRSGQTQRPRSQAGQVSRAATQRPNVQARNAAGPTRSKQQRAAQDASATRRQAAQQYDRSRYGSATSPNRRGTANPAGAHPARSAANYPGTRVAPNTRGGRTANATTRTYAATPATSAPRAFPTWGIAVIVAAAVVAVALVGFAIAGGLAKGGSLTGSTGTGNTTASGATSSSQMSVVDKEKSAEPVSFTMSFTGDCCLGNDENFGYSTRMPEYYDTYGPTYFFQNVKSIFDADDYTVVDMEGTFTTRTTRNGEQFAFKADPEYVDILTYGNVQAATLANNHSSDYGTGSYTDTWETLEQAGIVPFGYDDIAYVDIKGVKVALIGMYELDEYLGIMDTMLGYIQTAKDAGAQVIIMCAHWGEEKMYVPDDIQVELAHAAIDAGCDLIVGCHPHRVQGIEIYKGKYIAYSMGNFCFAGNNAPADMDCYIFQQTFTVVDGALQVDNNVNVIPCSISSDDTMNNYQPTPATGDQAEEINAKIADCNAQLADTYGVTTM